MFVLGRMSSRRPSRAVLHQRRFRCKWVMSPPTRRDRDTVTSVEVPDDGLEFLLRRSLDIAAKEKGKERRKEVTPDLSIELRGAEKWEIVEEAEYPGGWRVLSVRCRLLQGYVLRTFIGRSGVKEGSTFSQCYIPDPNENWVV